MPETPAERLARLRAQVQQGGGGTEVAPPDDVQARLAALRRGVEERAATATNPVSDAAAQVLAAPAKMVTTFGEGAARLGSAAYKAVTGDRTLNAADRAANALRTRRESITEAMAPETRTGRVAQVTSDLAANALPYVAAGGTLGLTRGAVASAGLSGVQSAAGRDASTVGMIADFTDDEGLTGLIQKASDNPTARVASDVAMDALISAGTYGIGRSVPRIKDAMRDFRERFRTKPVAPTAPRAPLALPSGQYEMPAVQEPITDPARLLPSEAQGVPRPRVAYDSPTGPAIPMPADVDAARQAALDAQTAATPEDIAAYLQDRERGVVRARSGTSWRRPADRVADAERAAMDADYVDPFTMPMDQLATRVPAKFPSGFGQMADDEVRDLAAFTQRAYEDAIAKANILDESAAMRFTEGGGTSPMGYQGAKRLMGTAEDARKLRDFSEEQLGMLEEMGLTPEDIRTWRQARVRLETLEPQFRRVMDEAERRGLLNAAEDTSFDFGANARPDADLIGDVPTAPAARVADDVARETLPPASGGSDLPPELRGRTAFDIGGVAGVALKTRPGQSALMGATGAALTEADDERIRNTGRGLIGLAALHAGAPYLRAGGRAVGRAAKEGLQQSELGRKVLDAISYDIQASPEVKAVVEAFEQATAKGRARSLELANKARGLGASGDRTVSDLVEREAFEATTLDPETAKQAAAVAQEISDEFTQLGRQKVKTGVLSAGTVAKREGRYLPRMYGETLAEDVADDVIIPQVGRKIRIKGDKIRNDALQPETRNMLGEVREASYRTQVGLERGYRDVAAARLFSSLREMPGVVNAEYGAAFDAVAEARAALDAAKASGDEAARAAAQANLAAATGRLRQLSERFETAREGFVRLPDTKAMGALRGAVVRKDVADYLNMVPNLSAPQGVFRNVLSFWKRAHTVWNPGTHVGNTISNAVMAHMGGLPLHQQVLALPDAIKDVRAYGPTTRYLAEMGVLERGLPTFGEGAVRGLTDDRTALRGLAATTRKQTRDALARGGINPMGRGERAVRGAMSKAEQAYALEDAVYRVALFKKLTKDGMPREAAADFVSKQFVDYQSRSPILGALKNTVSPFILYPAKAIPRVLEQVVEHPWRWAALAAIWGGLDQASRRQYGAIDERDLRPNQRQGKNTGYLLPGAVQVDAAVQPAMDALGISRREGDKYAFDVSRWTPLSALTGAAAPGSLGSAAFGDQMPAILQPGGPLVDAIAAANNIDPFSGEKVVTGADSPADKAMKILGMAGSFVAPSALSYHTPRVLRDLQNDDTGAAMVDAMGLLGLRPSVVRPGLQPVRELWQMERTLEDIQNNLMNDLRKAKSEDRREALRQRARDRMQQVMTQYKESRLP